jgi:hypothetical protein
MIVIVVFALQWTPCWPPHVWHSNSGGCTHAVLARCTNKNTIHTLSLYSSNNMNLDEIFSNHLLQATSELMKKVWVGFKNSRPCLCSHGRWVDCRCRVCSKAEVVKYEERRKKNRKSKAANSLSTCCPARSWHDNHALPLHQRTLYSNNTNLTIGWTSSPITCCLQQVN